MNGNNINDDISTVSITTYQLNISTTFVNVRKILIDIDDIDLSTMRQLTLTRI